MRRIDLLLEQHRDLLKQGSILVDPDDNGEDMRVLFYLEHTIQDASLDTTGKRREVSRQLQFIELDEQGNISTAGYAPFLDYRPLTEEESRARPGITRRLLAQQRPGRAGTHLRHHATGAAPPRRGSTAARRADRQNHRRRQ